MNDDDGAIDQQADVWDARHVVHLNAQREGDAWRRWLVCDCGWTYEPAPMLLSETLAIGKRHVRGEDEP